jgi:hypothetical protein
MQTDFTPRARSHREGPSTGEAIAIEAAASGFPRGGITFEVATAPVVPAGRWKRAVPRPNGTSNCELLFMSFSVIGAVKPAFHHDLVRHQEGRRGYAIMPRRSAQERVRGGSPVDHISGDRGVGAWQASGNERGRGQR